MKTIVFVVLFTNVCFQCVAPSQQNIRKNRAWVVDSLSLEEEHSGPFPYKLGDLNIEKNIISKYIVHGQGLDKDPKGIISIDTAEGSIYVHGKVDYEKYKHLTITFESGEKSPTLVVDIEILDVNDHAPVFNNLVYETTIHESTPQGEELVTVLASDDDQDGTANSLLSFKVVSVTPSPSNAEFFIQQTEGETIGKISFKGCLDYEEARQYTILVEAKDHGKEVQLSSTGTVIVNVIDKNNHQPEITGKPQGSVVVKEGKHGEHVCRLQVTDKDSRGSSAWKAKYSLQGEKADHFKIETDPETNDGVITVIEPLDYEEKSNLNIIVNVENEEPFFYCRVKGRPSKGLWDVENSQRSISTSVSLPMTVVVEDVNDPPVFLEPIKHITVMENVGIGHSLWTIRAEDPDQHTFVFVRGEDKNGWITVDEKTGHVSTVKVLDRESPLLKNDTYTVILYAVDNGIPAMTGTGTLIIYLIDENDNPPMLLVDKLCMCLSEKATEITAFDTDLHPYGAPFHFELMGNVEGRWTLSSSYGTTVRLIKEDTVFVGDHMLTLKISDTQGQNSIQTILVRVCNCDITANCNEPRAPTIKLKFTAVAVITLSFITLLGILLMACLNRKKKTKGWKYLEGPKGSLVNYNIEAPGTDCKVFSTDRETWLL
ncbi:cadherin-like protein 26 isoform X2 [Triplophysa dalaica]|uniref:cadherin-like protein 26 isoform X2 n=1 Tax=Triplophysa dalaica TaxID=1582913 RepID=UPI0024DFAF9C|nr:cadherin-like protein 26 isoform X2 [Triplophysa dalaica]